VPRTCIQRLPCLRTFFFSCSEPGYFRSLELSPLYSVGALDSLSFTDRPAQQCRLRPPRCAVACFIACSHHFAVSYARFCCLREPAAGSQLEGVSAPLLGHALFHSDTDMSCISPCVILMQSGGKAFSRWSICFALTRHVQRIAARCSHRAASTPYRRCTSGLCRTVLCWKGPGCRRSHANEAHPVHGEGARLEPQPNGSTP
jgi:hypothetical protein